jgi:hypothetical protein
MKKNRNMKKLKGDVKDGKKRKMKKRRRIRRR